MQGQNTNKTWNCLLCDSKEHQSRDCIDLIEAFKLCHVKFVEGKIAYFDSGKPVSLNVSLGGMKVLMKQKLWKKVAKVSTLHKDPCVYCFQISSLDQTSIENIGDEKKRRLAQIVKRKSRWDDWMLVNSITAQVEAVWNATVEDKRGLEDISMEYSQGREKQQRLELISTRSSKQDKKKELTFQSDEAFSQQSFQGITSQDQGKPKKTVKKVLGYFSARHVENTIEEDGIAKKFWQKKSKNDLEIDRK